MAGDCGVRNEDGGAAGGAKRRKVEDPVLLRPEEVARKLNISTRSVLRLLYEGKLRGAKIGRVWRVDRASLNRFLLRLLAACRDGETADGE